MFHIHLHLGASDSSAPAPDVSAAAIGDGTLLKLILTYGPQLLAFLIALGVIKLPPGVTLPFPTPPMPSNAP